MAGRISPPRWLVDQVARKEFRRCAKDLVGVVNDLDLSLLADYSQAFSDVISLTKIVEDEGYTLTSPKTGGKYVNPTANLLVGRRRELAALRKDLTFTPRSRGDKAGAKKKGGIRDKIRRGR
mgnify:CR=1 FL=1